MVKLRGVHSIDRSAKTSGMIVHKPHKLDLRKISVCYVVIEFSSPFIFPPEIWESVIVAAEVDIVVFNQYGLGWIRDLDFCGERMPFQRNVIGRRRRITGEIAEEPILA